VRPREQTAAYLKQVWFRLILPGALYLCVLCVPLELLIGRFGLPNDLTGPAIVGMVALILGIITHLASIVISVSYEGLIRHPRPSPRRPRA
jgi:preprotein translocase subunit SecY